MSSNNEESGMNDKIIKLKVDGSNRVVNTIEDQRTAQGVSLVCPFPALEVEIPIKFTNSQGVECAGRIHRIGVEDDPETGLPKLRLSVRNENSDISDINDSRETVAKVPSDSLIVEASGLTPVPEIVAQESIDELPVEVSIETEQSEAVEPAPLQALIDEEDELTSNLSGEINVSEKSLLDGLFDELDEADTSELLSLDEMEGNNKANMKDPAWVCYADMPIPSEFAERGQTRRRRRAIAVAAWMMVLGIATGGVFVLGKAGVVDLSTAKKYMSGLTESQESSSENGSNGNTLEELSVNTQDEKNAVDENAASQLTVDAVAPETTETAAVTEEVVDEPVDAPMVEEVADSAIEESSTDETSSTQQDPTEIVLPTRWPAEFATAYRLQNPNGVVVDVPGGLVKKEGWLNLKEEDQIIRSIKAVQRENGARFIVYVNGKLPNFKTTPKSGGIRLSLYYDAHEQMSSETQEVAMLEK